MKAIKQFINESSKFKNNLHDNLTEIENILTQKISDLINENNTLKIEVEGVSIDFLNNDEQSNESDSEIYSAGGILVEKYLSYLLNKEINSEDYFGSDFEKIVSDFKDLNVGTYSNYDFNLGNINFEIKCYHKTDNEGIYLTKKQKEEIGPDAFFILVQIGISKKYIMIKDVVVKQRKNLKIQSNYIKGIL